MKKVLHILPALNGGGVEQHVLDLVRLFPHHIVASSGGRLVSHVANHVFLPLNTKNPLQLHRNVSLINEIDYDILHAHSRAPAWSGLFAARKKRKPFVTTYHGTYNQKNSLKKFYNSVMIRGEKTVAISAHIQQHIQDIYKKESSLIAEGIDTDFFSTVSEEKVTFLKNQWCIPKNKKIILFPARFTRWKGHEVLMRALSHLSLENIFVVCVGCQSRQSYTKEIKEKSKGLPMLFFESIEDMRPAYQMADVVVSCSTDPEAFGRTTAEALAMKSLYVGTNHGATPEMCLHEKTGFLAQPACPKSIAEQINKALHTPYKKNIQHEARQHIEKHFSLHAMKEKLCLFYDALVT